MTGAKPCFYCGGPSSLLCDGILGFLKFEERHRDPKAGPTFTCDRPLCSACSKERMTVHVSMRPRSKSYWDSMDYCADCVREGLQSGNRIHNGQQRPRIEFTLEEGRAAQQRRLIRLEGPAK